MLRKVEINAKSKEDALQLAAKELGVTVEELSYTVDREVGKGLMGLLLGKEVIISAWITAEEEAERKIEETAKERAQSEKVTNGENPYAPKTEPHTRDYADKDRRKKSSKPVENKPKEKPVEKKAAENNEKVVEKTDDAEPKQSAPRARRHQEVTEKSVEDAQYFATELVHRIGLADATVTATNAGDCVSVDVSGERMGLLIGKRGDTLDAVQYLTSLYVNKAKNSYIKVSVDTENYRAKREETLVKLAKSLERRVIRDGESVSLEPMSPNERRIIHAALQNSNRVKTYSVGEEPARKIVVAAK